MTGSGPEDHSSGPLLVSGRRLPLLEELKPRRPLPLFVQPIHPRDASRRERAVPRVRQLERLSAEVHPPRPRPSDSVERLRPNRRQQVEARRAEGAVGARLSSDLTEWLHWSYGDAEWARAYDCAPLSVTSSPEFDGPGGGL